ncbi:MAG: MFS transporter [Verrucomicrobiaceae bacterium]|nr:MFS transporter [Verrucomicrobiaceae bacterium]
MSTAAPTRVRLSILTMATLVAFLMYLDRICLGEIVSSRSFKQSLHLSQDDVRAWVGTIFFWLPRSWQEHLGGLSPVDLIKGAFFWAYALAQVPAGWLSDRFGARALITSYIILWSLFTAATGLSWGFTSLMLARLGCGLAEAGYYPASCSLLTRWSHIEWRGFSSSLISWGGRVGGVAAPVLTAYVIASAGDWRWAGWVYGAAGVLIAIAYWIVFREHPRQHPRCNDAEIALLAEGRGDFLPVKDPPRRFPLIAACRSGNLWLVNGVQFFTNVGWAFLILSLPDYLRGVMHQDDKMSGTITTLALAIGVLSLPLGGMLTDVLSRRIGRRLGQVLPMSLTKFIAAGFYLVAVQTQSVWAAVVAFGLVTFFVDFGLPAMWTTMQDISGKHQAQFFGWGNMWGNFGAAIQPLLMTAVLRTWDMNHDFKEGVWLCAAALVAAGVLALGINSDRPVISER